MTTEIRNHKPFSEAEIKGIMNDTRRILCWDPEDMPEHVLLLIAKLHTLSWSTNEGLPGVIQTERGTLAGTAIADIIFVAAIARIFTRLFEVLRCNDIPVNIPPM